MEKPPRGSHLSLLGVDYFHHKTTDGGDLYLTRFGQPHWHPLLPENWFAPDWFEANRRRLVGTSTIYQTRTRKVAGRSLELVVKYSRVGEDVPGAAEGSNPFWARSSTAPSRSLRS